jgi:hypothetical protein
MKKTIAIIMIIIFGSLFTYSKETPTKKELAFYKAISYYMLGDKDNVKKNFDIYFNLVNNQKIKTAYEYLLKDDKITSSKLFETFIRNRYKRLDALIGYAFSIGEYSFYFEEYYFELAKEIFSKKSITSLCYGFFYLKEGDLGAAGDLIKKAIKIYDLPEYHIILSLYYRYKGLYSLERDELIKYLPSTDYTKGYIRVAEIYSKNSEIKKAYDFLIQNKDKIGDNDQYYIIKAQVEREMENFKEALNTIEKIKNKDNFEYIREKGILYYKTGNYKKTIKLFKKIEYKYKEDKEFSYYYGRALLNKNRGVAGKWLLRAGIFGLDVKDSILETPRGEEFLNKITNSAIIKFFRIDGFKWINDNDLLVWGKKDTSYKNYIYLVNNKGEILKSFVLDELVQNVVVSHDKTKIAIVSFSKRKDVANFYLMNLKTKSLRKINHYDIDEKIWNPMFSKYDDKIYFLEENYVKNIYSAPFSIENNMGKVYSFYPKIILSGFYYNIRRGRFSELNKNAIDKSSKLFHDAKIITEYYNKYSGFSNIIEKGKTISFSASDRVNLFVGDNYMLALEATGTESFIFHLYFNNGKLYEGKSSEILKGMPYEYLDFLGISEGKHLLYFKGMDKIIIIDYIKRRKKKIITNILTIVSSDNQAYYINKSLKIYKINMENYKITKPLKLKKYDKILNSAGYLFFVNKDLWLYKAGSKREKFETIFPRVKKYDISYNGLYLSFSKDNVLYITSLK